MDLRIKIPINGISVKIRKKDLVVSFKESYNVLSSGLMNAGFQKTQAIINYHVECDGNCNNCENKKSIDKGIREILRNHGLPDNTIVLMTAANMENLSKTTETFRDIIITALITAGTSNATHVGDPAAYYEEYEESHKIGTINIIILTNMCLTEKAMVDSIVTATEAKTTALYKLGVKSKYSGKQATGTGTDGIVVASDPKGGKVDYAGAHAKFGEMIGRAVFKGVLEAIEKQDGIQ